MLPREAKMVFDWTGLPESVKRLDRTEDRILRYIRNNSMPNALTTRPRYVTINVTNIFVTSFIVMLLVIVWKGDNQQWWLTPVREHSASIVGERHVIHLSIHLQCSHPFLRLITNNTLKLTRAQHNTTLSSRIKSVQLTQITHSFLRTHCLCDI